MRELKRAIKQVDTHVERAQRRIERVLDRKRDVPTFDDLENVTVDMLACLDALVGVDQVFVDIGGSGIFGPAQLNLDMVH